MTLQLFSARTNRVNLSQSVVSETNSMSGGDGGKGVELRLQSQEGQELTVRPQSERVSGETPCGIFT